jgi:hypothetical protein
MRAVRTVVLLLATAHVVRCTDAVQTDAATGVIPPAPLCVADALFVFSRSK